MSSPKKNSNVDPDYEMTEIVRERVRLKEDRENREKAETIVDIINREFQIELDHRQSQLELIQQRLNKAQKTLHLLRYVLITSYYNDKDVLVSCDELSTSNEDFSTLNRSRIHPAIKRLLGNNPEDYQFNFTKVSRKKIKYEDQQRNTESRFENQVPETTEPSSRTNMDSNENSDQSNNATNEIKQVDMGIKEELDTGRHRKKSKYRVVVGNISKWMPSESEEDKSTHKWMVYVRGSKENPDISHFVQKIVFYLHPSYQPNDVVELREGPFHLSRRGWGEFPLRVRIFFQCPLNKPVDIIHNLKLDKTFTGRQTLGNETVVNLFLYKTEREKKTAQMNVTGQMEGQISQLIKEEVDMENVISDFNSHEEDLKPDVGSCSISENNVNLYSEHDYCFIGVKQEMKQETDFESNMLTSTALPHTEHYFPYNCLTEHSYCVNNTSSESATNRSETNKLEQQTDLIYGIRDAEQIKSQIIEETVVDDLKILTRNRVVDSLQRFIISNGTVIAVKKHRRPQESLLKKTSYIQFDKNINNAQIISVLQNTYNLSDNTKVQGEIASELCPVIDYEKYKVDFPSHKFKNVHEALPYLFKRLPLVSELASDLNYRCTYPYAAKSLREYLNWNIGRRLSSEWLQAKTILNIISTAQLPYCGNWTVKSVIMYARSHGYTPQCNYTIFRNKTRPFESISNGVANSTDPSDSSTVSNINVPDIFVDVVDCTPDPEPVKNSCHKDRLVDHNLELACSYVKQAVLDVGIILKPEDIVPGVLFNATERLLLQAALSLAEDLLRNARANLVLQGNFREGTSIIGVEEVQQALSERPEFKILLKSNAED